MTKTSAWLASARVANLPTIWSTVICVLLVTSLVTSFALSGDIKSGVEMPTFLWGAILISCVAYSFLYCGGCLLGDAWDAHWDREHKPERPIPRGILHRVTVFVVGGWLMVDGLILLNVIPWLMDSPFSWPAFFCQLSLFAVVLSYARFHKKSALLAISLMSSCRALLVISAAAPLFWLSFELIDSDQKVTFFTWVILYALAMAAYTIGIVLVARTESSPEAVPKKIRNLVFMILAPALFASLTVTVFKESPSMNAFPLIGIIFFIYILLKTSRHLNANTLDKPAFVSAALAAFPLIDFIVILPLGLFCIWLPLIPLACYVFALILQKLTPAT